MSVTKDKKEEMVKQFGKAGNDTGSSVVQIALFTERIKELTSHMKTHKKDFSSRRGLLKLVSKRDRLLKYVKKNEPEQYYTIINKLGIRK